ncbi:MAG: DegT/DnrJ/EryC1/StrS family aminotransferase [Candidatus Omnitrophica bacterium]|nr:DegT/DnrJ/EryC1/StrS family aminotransferase [Candidatus Omnitrophota bacterium]
MDLKSLHRDILPEYLKKVKNIFDSNDFILGEEVKQFESEFAVYCNVRYAVGVNSGTDALFLGLLSLGIGKNDEVIVPAFTYIASALAITYTGAKPKFVDIEESSYNIDVDSLNKAISKKTKAIMPVHLYGQPANMPQILKIADKYGLKVIEDSAQAHGADWKDSKGNWHKAGSSSDVGCFSFYPSKNLGACGDGGIVVTNSKKLYKRLLMLRDYGRTSRYDHRTIGYNSRLDTLQAAVLRLKLKKLDRANSMRKYNASIYNSLLNGCPGIKLPIVSDFARHIYHVYAIRIKNRNNLIKLLKKRKITALIHYPIPLHLQKAYKFLGYKKGDFPVSERVAKEVLSLPMYPHLKKREIEYVASCLRKIYER